MQYLLIIVLLCSLPLIVLGSEKLYIVSLQRNSLLLEVRNNPTLKNAVFADKYRQELRKSHDSILSSLTDNGPKVNKVYSFVNSINAFSALLTESQVKILKKNTNVEWVLESRKLHPSTTYTPTFLNLDGPTSYNSNPVYNRTTGIDVIIGILDTGIFPESPSFDDAGLGPIPTKFRGSCQQPLQEPGIKCNKKLIGAKYFYSGYEARSGKKITSNGDYASARDVDGHGTHVASTAGGSKTKEVKAVGGSVGSARGVAFNARISVYKVCWGFGSDAGCETSDIIAALEAGVADRVDVFSLSLGAPPQSIATDSFALSMLKVVSTSKIPAVLAAGNEGERTVSNGSPWMLTVAASTHDRIINPRVILGNGQKFMGLSSPDWSDLSSNQYPLIDSASASIDYYDNHDAELCYEGSLDSEIVGGRIVLCKRGGVSRLHKSNAVYNAGGIGMILYNQEGESTLYSDDHYVPSIHVTTASGLAIIDYIKTSNPTAGAGNVIVFGPKYRVAPSIANFSSTGPFSPSKFLIKPDITAPGVDIIAAYTNSSSSTSSPRGLYLPLQGTSMATPHVSGAVALIKSVYPSWNPSRIYSAIITTGTTLNNVKTCIKDGRGFCASPIHMGGGHLNVPGALDPGLVFDMQGSDYKAFLCTNSGGYTSSKCPKLLREVDLNLPYLSIPDMNARVTTTRKLTLVGPPRTYKVSIVQPAGAKVTVLPSKLVFTSREQSLNFKIAVVPLSSYTSARVNYDLQYAFTFGTVTWSDGVRNVKFNVGVNIP